MDTKVHMVTIEPQRMVADTTGREDACRICAEPKPLHDFPSFSPTRSCKHTPGTCHQCLETSIRTQLGSKVWTDIACPECRAKLEYSDVEAFADKVTLRR